MERIKKSSIGMVRIERVVCDGKDGKSSIGMERIEKVVLGWKG